MTQGSMISLSKFFQEASSYGVKNEKQYFWKQSDETLWCVCVCVWRQRLFGWKKLEILKLHYHFQDRTWLYRGSYGGNTPASLKLYWIGPFTSSPFILFYFCIFNDSLWKYEGKNSQTRFWISKMVEEAEHSYAVKIPWTLMSLRWRFKYLFCLYVSSIF